jgi:hypothetical protein
MQQSPSVTPSKVNTNLTPNPSQSKTDEPGMVDSSRLFNCTPFLFSHCRRASDHSPRGHQENV